MRNAFGENGLKRYTYSYIENLHPNIFSCVMLLHVKTMSLSAQPSTNNALQFLLNNVIAQLY